jgi:RNA polymerase sigma factor (sigma-70 family)
MGRTRRSKRRTRASKYKELKRVQRRKTRYPDRADDLVQDAFLRFFAYAARHSFEDDGEDSPAHVLFALAGRAAADASRREQKERNIMANLTLRPRAKPRSPHALAAAEEASRQVRAALAKLPPALREAAVWHFLDDLSVAEIHERTGIPKDALRQRISRAKKMLTELLSEYWWERQQGGTR